MKFIKSDSEHKNGSCLAAIVYIIGMNSISTAERVKRKKMERKQQRKVDRLTCTQIDWQRRTCMYLE
jgi:hypothetical protein